MAVPLLALVIPVQVAAPVAVLASITIALIAVLQDWRHIHLRGAVWLVLSTLAGIPLGLLLLKSVPEAGVKAVLAGVILAFLGLFSVETPTAGNRQRRVLMAFWVRGRHFGRSLWGEWTAARDLWLPPRVVPETVPRDTSGVFPACQPDWGVRLWISGALDFASQPLLSRITTAGGGGYVSNHFGAGAND